VARGARNSRAVGQFEDSGTHKYGGGQGVAEGSASEESSLPLCAARARIARLARRRDLRSPAV